MKTNNEKLKAARLSNGLTQRDVAEKLGVTERQYLRYEKGDTEIKDYELQHYIEVINSMTNLSTRKIIEIKKNVVVDNTKAKHTKNKMQQISISTSSYSLAMFDLMCELLSKVNQDPLEQVQEIGQTLEFVTVIPVEFRYNPHSNNPTNYWYYYFLHGANLTRLFYRLQKMNNLNM